MIVALYVYLCTLLRRLNPFGPKIDIACYLGRGPNVHFVCRQAKDNYRHHHHLHMIKMQDLQYYAPSSTIKV